MAHWRSRGAAIYRGFCIHNFRFPVVRYCLLLLLLSPPPPPPVSRLYAIKLLWRKESPALEKSGALQRSYLAFAVSNPRGILMVGVLLQVAAPCGEHRNTCANRHAGSNDYGRALYDWGTKGGVRGCSTRCLALGLVARGVKTRRLIIFITCMAVPNS